MQEPNANGFASQWNIGTSSQVCTVPSSVPPGQSYWALTTRPPLYTQNGGLVCFLDSKGRISCSTLHLTRFSSNLNVFPKRSQLNIATSHM